MKDKISCLVFNTNNDKRICGHDFRNSPKSKGQRTGFISIFSEAKEEPIRVPLSEEPDDNVLSLTTWGNYGIGSTSKGIFVYIFIWCILKFIFNFDC